MDIDDVERLVEDVAVSLKRGLSLEDIDGLLLAYSSNQPHPDKVRVDFLLSKRVPADVDAWQKQHGVAVAVRPVAVPANPDLGMEGRVCVPLLVRGYRVGYLWIQYNADDTSAAAILNDLGKVHAELEVLAGLLLESSSGQSSQRRQSEQTFIRACEGDRGSASALMAWPQFHGADSWLIVVAVEERDAHGFQDPIAATQTHRSSALAATVGLNEVLFSAGHATHSIFLFRDSAGRAPHAEALVRYQRELSKRLGRPPGRVVLGASDRVHTVRELPRAYQQARIAAQAGMVEPRLGELVDCANTGIYQLFADENWSPPQSLIYRALQEADVHRELVPFLEQLFDSDGSVQEVARALHLHRSSLYNRLSKVRQALGKDPLAGTVRLELHAAFKAERWLRRPRLA